MRMISASSRNHFLYFERMVSDSDEGRLILVILPESSSHLLSTGFSAYFIDGMYETDHRGLRLDPA